MLKNICKKIKKLWKEVFLSIATWFNECFFKKSQRYIIWSQLGLGQLKNRNVLQG